MKKGGRASEFENAIEWLSLSGIVTQVYRVGHATKPLENSKDIDAFYHPLCEKLKMYFVTGGMPEAVRVWAEERSVDEVQQVLGGIIRAYEHDFVKHPDPAYFPNFRARPMRRSA